MICTHSHTLSRCHTSPSSQSKTHSKMSHQSYPGTGGGTAEHHQISLYKTQREARQTPHTQPHVNGIILSHTHTHIYRTHMVSQAIPIRRSHLLTAYLTHTPHSHRVTQLPTNSTPTHNSHGDTWNGTTLLSLWSPRVTRGFRITHTTPLACWEKALVVASTTQSQGVEEGGVNKEGAVGVASRPAPPHPLRTALGGGAQSDSCPSPAHSLP